MNSMNSKKSMSPNIRAIFLLLIVIPIVAFFLIAGFFLIALFVAIVVAIALLLAIARLVRRSLNATTATDRPSIPMSDADGRENVRVIRPN
jgi:Na+/melibiose symporter-like transporter